MERLKLKYSDSVKALQTLKDISKEKYTTIIRDATIQRFEYTFEALWKFLKEEEGIIVNSPKECFRNIFSLGYLTDEETVNCLEMVDSRNDTSHTYKEEVAKIIYNKISSYTKLIKNLLGKFNY